MVPEDEAFAMTNPSLLRALIVDERVVLNLASDIDRLGKTELAFWNREAGKMRLAPVHFAE